MTNEVVGGVVKVIELVGKQSLEGSTRAARPTPPSPPRARERPRRAGSPRGREDRNVRRPGFERRGERKEALTWCCESSYGPA
jgi:hypothetical protein